MKFKKFSMWYDLFRVPATAKTALGKIIGSTVEWQTVKLNARLGTWATR